jgi:hypothetical protein
LERVVEPGAITALFQPILRISGGEATVVAVEGLARGPRGCTLEAPDILFEFARRKNEESIVDRAAISAILRFAPVRPGTSASRAASDTSSELRYRPRRLTSRSSSTRTSSRRRVSSRHLPTCAPRLTLRSTTSAWELRISA